MNDNPAFWWNWCIQLAVAVGTLLAALVALFRDKILSMIFPIKLHMKIKDYAGEFHISEINQTSHNSRYYHVNIARNNWRTANLVQVYLLHITARDSKKSQ